jgi:hypothetical protein
MKAHIDFFGTVLEKQLTVKNVSHTLSEGEGFTETVHLERGSTYVVTTEGWPDMDAVTIRLGHENGEAVVPEVDNETAALYFAPRRTGFHRLRVVMAAVAPGKTSAVVGATVRKVLDLPSSRRPRERLRKAV